MTDVVFISFKTICVCRRKSYGRPNRSNDASRIPPAHTRSYRQRKAQLPRRQVPYLDRPVCAPGCKPFIVRIDRDRTDPPHVSAEYAVQLPRRPPAWPRPSAGDTLPELCAVHLFALRHLHHRGRAAGTVCTAACDTRADNGQRRLVAQSALRGLPAHVRTHVETRTTTRQSSQSSASASAASVSVSAPASARSITVRNTFAST